MCNDGSREPEVDPMDGQETLTEIKQLLEELVAVQMAQVALHIQARDARGDEQFTDSQVREAAALVRDNRDRLLAALRSAPEQSAPDERAGSRSNIEKAKRMSMKQKRYDLGEGLF